MLRSGFLYYTREQVGALPIQKSACDPPSREKLCSVGHRLPLAIVGTTKLRFMPW